MDQLRSKLAKEILDNPPLGHDPAAAADLACQEVVAEVAAGEEAATSFDNILGMDCAVRACGMGRSCCRPNKLGVQIICKVDSSHGFRFLLLKGSFQ